MSKKRKNQHHHHAPPPPSQSGPGPFASSALHRSYAHHNNRNSNSNRPFQPDVKNPPLGNNDRSASSSSPLQSSLPSFRNTQTHASTQAHTQTPVNPLTQKFALLESAIADILAETATEDKWREALGSGNEKRVEFVNVLKALKNSGDLGWVGSGGSGSGNRIDIDEKGIGSSHTPASSMAINTSATASATTTTTTFKTPSTSTENEWPPPLPPIISPALLSQVFTHPSHLSAQTPSTLTTDLSNTNYQRLEFLGDSALRYILARTLYHRFPTARENILASLRSNLETNQNLQHYSTIYSLPSRVKIGKEALQSETYKQTKFCADVFEAYIGALILDDPSPQGFITASSWLEKLIEPRLQAEAKEIGDSFVIDRGAREKLSRLIAGVPGVSLDYAWEGGGGGNEGGFWYVVYFTGYGYEKLELGRGWGNNKGNAMLRAAMVALENESLIEEVKGKKDVFLKEKKKKKKGEGGVESGGGGVGGKDV